MIENGVRELWYFVHSEVKKLGHIETGELQKHIDMLLQDLGHRERCLSNIYIYTYTKCKIQYTSIVGLICQEMLFHVVKMVSQRASTVWN